MYYKPFWLALSAATFALVVSGCGNTSAPATNNAAPHGETAHDSSTHTNATSAHTATTQGSANAAISFDQQFIDSMVPHHESAVMMAQMVVTRAQFPEVRALAKSIIADQDKEIAQMKAWRKAWFGSDAIPPMPGHDGMVGMDHSAMDHSQMNHEMDSTMKDGAMSNAAPSAHVMTMPGVAMGLPITGRMDMSLISKAQGSGVDREFLRMMIPHHANAIVMAQEVLLQSKRPKLQKLARAIIEAQAQEIGTMEAIARKRFGAL